MSGGRVPKLKAKGSLIEGALFFAGCVILALLLAVQEYATVGEFFAMRDVLHHEVIEVTLVSFGMGAFSSLAYLALLRRQHVHELVQADLNYATSRATYKPQPTSRAEMQVNVQKTQKVEA